MTAASWAAVLTAVAGVLTAVAAALHSLGTRRMLSAHLNSMSRATTGSASRARPDTHPYN